MRRLWTYFGIAATAVMVSVIDVGCGSAEDSSTGADLDRSAADPNPRAIQDEAYFSVRADRRPCAAPLCGGFWIKRVNATRTLCADGQWSQSCYVAELTFAPLGLGDEDEDELRSDFTRVLIRGRVSERDFPGTGPLGAIEVSEAWRAPPGVRASQGTFFLLEGEGDAMTARQLNSTKYPQKISRVDFEEAHGTTADKSEAFARIGRQGLVVAGADKPAPTGVGLAVSEFYARVDAQRE